MRCFVALEFEGCEEFFSKTLEAVRALGLHASVVPKENLHATICFLGEISEKQAAEKAAAIASLEFSQFEVRFGGILFFPSEEFIRVACLGVQSNGRIEELHGIVHALVAKGTRAEREARGFNAHAALARVKTPENVDKLRAWANNFNESEVSCRAVASRLVLKKSVLIPGAVAKYEDLAVAGKK